MNARAIIRTHRRSKSDQRGITLPTVLVLLLLSIVSVLGAFRAGILNEQIVGNVSDYNRARAAAEAMLRDAEMDIRGRLPSYDTLQPDGTRGYPCRPTVPGGLISQAGYIGCRNAGANPWFPLDSDDFDTVSDLVTANDATNRCMQGICVPLTMTALANIGGDITATTDPSGVKALGATYGQYTRNALTAPGVSGNPILNGAGNNTGNNARAWYWIEAFRYQATGNVQSINAIAPVDKTFVYRITAVALGMKPGTRVVLKSTFIPYPSDQDK